MANITPISDIRAFLEAGSLATARTTLGLGSVDNTADLDKPISTATEAVTDAITARQWVEVLSDTVAENAVNTEWADGVVSVMSVSGGAWPEDFGVAIVDRRVGRTYREFNSTTGNRYTSRYGASWSPWVRITQSTTTSVTGTTYTAIISDSIISATNSAGVAMGLMAAATAGDGYKLTIKNVGAVGDITLDGDGSETIDGELTWTIAPQDWLIVYTDGTSWHIIG